MGKAESSFLYVVGWAKLDFFYVLGVHESVQKISNLTNRGIIVYDNDYQNYIMNIFTLLTSKLLVLKYEKY